MKGKIATESGYLFNLMCYTHNLSLTHTHTHTSFASFCLVLSLSLRCSPSLIFSPSLSPLCRWTHKENTGIFFLFIQCTPLRIFPLSPFFQYSLIQTLKKRGSFITSNKKREKDFCCNKKKGNFDLGKERGGKKERERTSNGHNF